jgi:hypothetical protein
MASTEMNAAINILFSGVPLLAITVWLWHRAEYAPTGCSKRTWIIIHTIVGALLCMSYYELIEIEAFYRRYPSTSLWVYIGWLLGSVMAGTPICAYLACYAYGAVKTLWTITRASGKSGDVSK